MGDALFVTWQNTINLGAALIAALLGLMALAGTWYAVRRKNRIDGLAEDVARWKDTADRWKTERDAAMAAEQRLKLEHLEEKAKFAEEQREIRHQLKNDLSSCQMELAAANARTDQTVVLDGQKGIIAVIERIDERAAKRDAALLENQREITVALERLADRITGQVAEKVSEVVQEKVDQLQSDAPSPDSK